MLDGVNIAGAEQDAANVTESFPSHNNHSRPGGVDPHVCD